MRIEVDIYGNVTEHEDAPATPITLEQSIVHLEHIVFNYIQSKVDEYNLANGVKFPNIDAFTKYAVNSSSQYNVIANKFLVYADNIWKTFREYQKTLTTVPTDAEVKAVLDKVVF
jgi:hypothetical protein